MDEASARHDRLLMLLVTNLQQGALVQLGKLADPVTGKVAVDLPAARLSIDLLDMLRAKCRQGTDDAVVREMDRIVMDLQLNYADTARRETADTAGEQGEERDAAGAAASPPEETVAPDGTAEDGSGSAAGTGEPTSGTTGSGP